MYMVCITCGSKLAIVNSRHQKQANRTWRRRKCPGCGSLFTTIEAIDYPTSLVIKDSSGSLSAFSRDRLFIDVYECLKHRKTALSDATSLTDTVLAQLLPAQHQSQIERSALVAIVQQVLARFDTAASVQYAAYHS